MYNLGAGGRWFKSSLPDHPVAKLASLEETIMTDVRIYLPAKTAMQSGRANLRKWALEFEPRAAKQIDPLMGWTGSADTRTQVRLKFDSKDEAVAFAEKNGLSFHVQEPNYRRIRPKKYAENFAFTRIR